MSKILEMIEKRNKAWEGAKAFVESNKDKDGLLSEEHTKQYQEMENKVLNFSKEIDRLQREEQMEKMMEKPINAPIKEKPRQDVEEKTGRARKAYKESMLQALRTNFKQVSNILQEGVDADGGYLVPEEYDARLISVLEEENIIRNLATVITTAGNHKINIAGTRPAAAWIDEGAELKFGDATFKQMLLDAHKLHVAIKVTEELLYDSAFNLETYITEQFGKALANAEEDAFLNGDGNNKPTGIFHETNGGTFLEKVSTIKSDDVINLVHALKRPYRKNAVFITNDKTIAQIRKFKDSNGAYIWQPSYQQSEPDKLLGYPIYTSAYAPENAIAFGDFSYYNIGDRGARSFKALTELFAGNGMIGYVAKERVDGKLIVKEAVQILSTQG
ncbi:TPA: phage major capsid protein [Streptococcus suis]|nr:phage major capsid protein [Streptococcus suis]HEM6356438.1 phage major capsid protein [Streptococcus suis]HEM6380572.1 phage major capsid protein [Streptococcus suis]HEM6409792.1 phage major capsid protein [Streptococcus suis]